MNISRYRLPMSWAGAGVVVPPVLFGIAWSLESLSSTASVPFALAAAASFPFCVLLWWPAMTAPTNAALFCAVALGAFLLNSSMFAMVGLLHACISSWQTRPKVAVLALVLFAVLGFASFVAYGTWWDVA
jgi:hypothetical protein